MRRNGNGSNEALSSGKIAGYLLIAVLITLILVGGLWMALQEREADLPVARTSSEDLVWLRREVVDVTTSGATSGSGSTARDLHGRIYAVHLDYASGISTTTDVTVTVSNPTMTILQVSDYYTDTWYYPVAQRHSSAGATVTDYAPFVATEAVAIAVGQTTSGTQVLTATILWGE